MEKKINLSKNTKKLIYIFSSIILIISFFFIGFFVSKNKYKLKEDEQKIIDTYHLLKEDWLYGNEFNNIVDDATTSLISGVASTVDDSYTFYTKTEAEQNLSLDGKGFGFTSHYYNGQLYVVEVYNGPSFNKLQEGDILTSCLLNNSKINFKEHSLSEIQSFLNQSSDSDFIFTVNRNDSTFDVSIKKDTYLQEGITLKVSPNSSNNYRLVLKINSFLDDRLSIKVDSLLSSYSLINELVLDLSDNTGGYVYQAEALASLFVKKDTLIYQIRNKNDEIISTSIQRNSPKYTFSNIKVIINNNSASASELFTLALRKGTDCKVVGLTSYGKGVSQSFKTFSDGSVIRYTQGLVYGPKRDNENISVPSSYDKEDVFSIHKTGITPDTLYSFDYSFLNSYVELNNLKYQSNNQVEHVFKVLNNLYPDENFSNMRFDEAMKKYTEIINNKYSLSLKTFDDNNFISKEVSDYLIKEGYDKYLSYKKEMIQLYYYD